MNVHVVSISEELISAPESVDSWCLKLREALGPLENKKDRFALELLFREALQNALCHGNGYDPRRKLRCGLEIQNSRAWGWVEHEGEPWDYSSPQVCTCPEEDEQGRGMEIISQYADEHHWENQGLKIVFYRTLKGGTAHG